MSELYNRIENLCKDNGINITTMCKETGASRGSLTDLKAGRSSTLSQKALIKIADYFDVTVDYLISGSKEISEPVSNNIDDDIKFALFNGSEGITDAMYEEVKQFAAMVKLREEAKKGNKETVNEKD